MELLLWRWSVGVQWASLAMITVFFLVLERSLRLAELRSWVGAWFANLLALGITVVYWNWRPSGGTFRLISAGYLGAKAAFGVLLILGALQIGRKDRAATRPILVGPVVLFAVAGALITSLEELGTLSNPSMCLLFTVGGFLLLRQGGGVRWLAAAMLLRALLFFLTSVAFVLTSAASGGPRELLPLALSFLSFHSFVDTGAEWLLALASVLALSDRVSSELRQSNRELLSTQEELLSTQEKLRRLIDRDPLTALQNQRALPEVFRRVQPGGALLLFFDLDGFKEVNDRHGHQAGDECLRRFARGLRECFRPADALIRYGGDEFLVVAPGLESGPAGERIARLRERLRTEGVGEAQLAFSVGLAPLEPGGVPAAALRAADRAMYEAKGSRVA
jgi:diguanylate cyclase (GGDEF)-like protein